MTGIGGIFPIKNGYQHDYPWREAIQSILPVCDEIIVSDGGSTDGTIEAVQEWSKVEPKIKLRHWKPDAPHHGWLLSWINFTRELLSTPFQFLGTADEVLHEESYDAVLRFVKDHPNGAAMCHTRNFWFHPKRLIPPGQICGHRGYRLAPTRMWMLADWPDDRGREMMDANVETEIEVNHYNWLRKFEKYVPKEIQFQEVLGGGHDARFDNPKLTVSDFTRHDYFPTLPVPFFKPHPAVMRRWLSERGHST